MSSGSAGCCRAVFTEAGGFLLGRRTYEIFAAYWPKASAEQQVVAGPLNSKPKYVVSRTLSAPLGWHNSTLLAGDVAQAVAALKDKGRRRPARDRQHGAGAHAHRRMTWSMSFG